MFCRLLLRISMFRRCRRLSTWKKELSSIPLLELRKKKSLPSSKSTQPLLLQLDFYFANMFGVLINPLFTRSLPLCVVNKCCKLWWCNSQLLLIVSFMLLLLMRLCCYVIVQFFCLLHFPLFFFSFHHYFLLG